MVIDLLVLATGVIAAAVGGELFVRGSVGLAAWARVPAGLIGATVAAFATSTPELSVSLQAAASGRPELALGDALGSNVLNVTVVLGIALVVGGACMSRRAIRRDLTTAAIAPLITLLALVDGRLVRAEAVVLLVIFAGWLVAVARHAQRERSSAGDVLGEPAGWPVLATTAGGLAALIVAGRLIVVAAKGIGAELGLDPFVIGATVVAVATSTPEIATAIISQRKGHSEVGVGTVLGSNVFNNLWIVGIAALVDPIESSVDETILAVGMSLIGLALIFPNRAAVIPRSRVPALLTLAAAYIAATIVAGE
jgi:cation:H+ antiporter